jgi:hypothetical protein
MVRLRYVCSVLCAVLTLILGASQAHASPLILNYSGVFGPTSTLGGNAFGADTPFTFQATFDSTPDQTFVGGAVAVFDALVTFDIAGFGIFTSDPTADVNVLLQDDRISDFGAGLVTTVADPPGSLVGVFATATPPFLAGTPTPTVLTGFLGSGSPAFPFTIALSGGAGDLVINDLASLGETATT